MASNDVPRRPPGAGGGQFAPKPGRRRSEIRLDVGPSDGLDGDPLPDPDDIRAADGAELWSYVRHGDPAVRAEAAGSLNLTPEQCAELADPERQPTSVRAAVARLPYPGVASRAVRDPEPIVRWLAAEGGWDLTGEEQILLAGDREVARVRAVMAGIGRPSQ